jgi:hypothetical protein
LLWKEVLRQKIGDVGTENEHAYIELKGSTGYISGTDDVCYTSWK